MSKLWDLVEKNRWTVIAPLAGAVLWVFTGIACTPTTESPVHPGVQVTAERLELDYHQWLADCNTTAKRFDFAARDIERQVQQWGQAESALMQLASGSVANWGGLLQLLMGSGIIGLFADNIRKNGVIGGLKRNK